jgi:fatty acid synthase subunit alpha
LGFIADNIDSEAAASSSRVSLLYNALNHFSNSYLSVKDIHSLAASFDTDVRKTVLSSYFKAVAALEVRNVPDIPRSPSSALLNAVQEDDASIFAIFGGQGTNDVILEELQALYDIYTPYVAPFIEEMTKEVLIPLASSSPTSFYSYGLNVISWLTGVSTPPPVSYLVAVPVSLPLIGLTQLAQYLVAARVASVTPGDLLSSIAGATGHSQGVVSAVAIAASTTYESFNENAKKALKWLLLAGSRAQTGFPVLSIEPSIIADSIEGGEGVPSTMLSVVGLTLKELTPHIDQTNKYLPDNSQLGVSLHNGIKAFVVTGPARALHGLVTSLRKIRAPSGLDQSKVPFSQRKAVFYVRFLGVGVPFHSSYLTNAVDQFLNEDLKGEELWTIDELRVPVYHTNDGAGPRFYLPKFY